MNRSQKFLRRSFVVVLLAGSIINLYDSRETANASAATVWHVDYTTNFAGPMKLKFSDQAISMHLDKLGVIIIATAPKWNSLVYNNLNKRYMNVSNEQWRASKFIDSLLKRHQATTGEVTAEYTSNTKTIEGLKATQVILRKKNSENAMEESSEIWASDQLSVPSNFKQFLSVALGVSESFKGTPLQISVMQRDLADKKPHMVQALAVYKIVKGAAEPEEFKPLTGYKEVKNEVNLMIEDDTEPDKK